MSKKTCNLNLDEETISALDEAAEELGMSRSQVANQILAGAVGTSTVTGVLSTMFNSALAARRKRRAEELVGVASVE